MKTLVIGDIHIKSQAILPRIETLLEQQKDVQRIVFTGDYCDDWHVSSNEFRTDIENFAEWVNKTRKSIDVDLVFGNHDFQYLLGRPGPGTKPSLYPFVREVLFPLGLRIAHVVDGYLLTHAGLTAFWAERFLDEPLDANTAFQQLNAMLDSGDSHSLDVLDMCGYGRGGFEIPSPLWADKFELESDPACGIPQIVGHTPVSTVHASDDVHISEEIWFCDTFSTTSHGRPIGDGTVLLVEDGKPTPQALPEN